ncbi:tetratricopeptide repeat protein [soil metagenome]
MSGELSRAYEQAVSLFRRGEYQAAAAGFERLLEVAPSNAVIWTALGAALQLAHRNPAARTCYEKAIALDPGQLDARTNLGTVLQSLGHFEQAADSFRAALAIEPQHRPALAGLAASLDWLGRYAEALELLEPLADDPTDPETALVHAQILLHTGREAEGRALLERAFASGAEAPPLRQRMHFLLGDLHDAAADYDEAFSHYRRGNELKQLQWDRAAHRAGLDATIDAFTGTALGRLPRAETQSPVPIFIVGMPRSGTSLVEQILAAHPAVLAAGELGLVPALAGGLSREDDPWARKACALSAPELTELAAKFRSAAPAPENGIERLTDKTPGNFLFLGLVELLFPNARIIHVVRDPLDACVSCYFQNFGGRNLPFSYDLRDLGFYYRDYERLMEHWRSVSGLPMLDVVYEELVADPEAGSRAIVAFAGLDWHPRCLNPHEIERSVATLSHAQVRRPIYRTSVGRFRHYDRYLGPLKNALFGPPSGGAAKRTSGGSA